MKYKPPHVIFDRLNLMAEMIETEIRIAMDKKVDNLRLNYALRKKPEDKNNYTSESLKEVRSQIGNYQGNLAAFLREAVINEEVFYDDNELLPKLCYNYVDGLFWPEELEELDQNLLENEDYIWQSRIGGDKIKIKEIQAFIDGMALANLYHDLQLFEGTGIIEENNGIDLKPLPSNKSLLFNGKKMNLTERIKVANEILNFEGQIRILKISDTEKYQLMAYILGNDVSNVRNVINGTRPNKVREKELNSYLKNLMK